ncbi:MAG TPA: DNA-formamidopyrimidine glycosylase family protein [Armatimonadota bacterium]|jgi:formamidopyrimidine-DNA glycosylase
MIELPEATIIAQQINAELKGKRIADGNRGNSPHKFAFYTFPPEEYAAILQEKTIGVATANGSCILVEMAPGYTLVLGLGGERIVYHRNTASLPKKHQLLLHFTDDTCLTVTVQGWGAALLLTDAEVSNHPYINLGKPSPLSDEFTLNYFLGLFAALEPNDSSSMKYFMITKPGVLGIGNGCLQDILWRAYIHPRRRAVHLTQAEQQGLYAAIRESLQQMVEGGGRDGDYDLYDQPGGYQRILHSKTVGQPCAHCSTPIEKASFLGGTVYFCPQCQVIG